MAQSDPLGRYTKFSSQPKNSGENERSLRFYLQSIARKLLPDERIRICLRHRRHDVVNVEILYSEENRRARYSGLMRCGSLWSCPLCSVSISEMRRKELTEAINNNRQKYMRLLITYTARHHTGMPLQPTMIAMTNAYRRYKSGRFGMFLREEMGQIGAIRATEITYGRNGWHPHFHELAFFDWDKIGRDTKPIELEFAMIQHCAAQWVKCLRTEGLDAIERIAYDVTSGGPKVDEYVAKYGRLPIEIQWGQASELTRQQSKLASMDGRTPFELLIDYENGCVDAGRLFIEYFHATKGRKQLFWSPGLKEMLGLTEKTDDEALEDTCENDEIILAAIEPDDWRLVIKQDKRAELLNIASLGDISAVWRFIGQLREDDTGEGGAILIDDLLDD